VLPTNSGKQRIKRRARLTARRRRPTPASHNTLATYWRSLCLRPLLPLLHSLSFPNSLGAFFSDSRPLSASHGTHNVRLSNPGTPGNSSR